MVIHKMPGSNVEGTELVLESQNLPPEQPDESSMDKINKSGEGVEKALDKAKVLENYVGQMEEADKLFHTDAAKEKFVTTKLGDVMMAYDLTGAEIENYMASHDIDKTKWNTMSLEEKNRVIYGTIGEKEVAAYKAGNVMDVPTDEKESQITDFGETPREVTELEVQNFAKQYNVLESDISDYMGDRVGEWNGYDEKQKLLIMQEIAAKKMGLTGSTADLRPSAETNAEVVQNETGNDGQQVHPLTGQVIGNATPESIPNQNHEESAKEPLVNPVTGQVIGNATPESIPGQPTQQPVQSSVPEQSVASQETQPEMTLAQTNMKNQHGVEEWTQTPDGTFYVRKSDGTSEMLPADVFDDRYGKTLMESNQ